MWRSIARLIRALSKDSGGRITGRDGSSYDSTMSELNRPPVSKSNPARDVLAALCAAICLLSILACFAPLSVANSHSQNNSSWSLARYATGSAFLFGVLGAMAAESVAWRVMLVLGAIVGPFVSFVIFGLSVSH
jgi:hypothetical protein